MLHLVEGTLEDIVVEFSVSVSNFSVICHAPPAGAVRRELFEMLLALLNRHLAFHFGKTKCFRSSPYHLSEMTGTFVETSLFSPPGETWFTDLIVPRDDQRK